MDLRFRLSRSSKGAVLVHPLTPIPRTAILGTGFKETRLIRAFPNGWTNEVERFHPTALAGTVEVLHPLTTRKIDLQHALIVFHNDLKARLTDAQRDLFWDSFKVPIFEQILGPDNQLLAYECDAHAGLHLVGDLPDVELDRAPCPCGSLQPLLMAPIRAGLCPEEPCPAVSETHSPILTKAFGQGAKVERW